MTVTSSLAQAKGDYALASIVIPGGERDYALAALRSWSLEGRGITPLLRCGRDPRGGTLQLQITPLLVSLARVFIFHMSSLRQAWFGHLENKNPAEELRE